MFVCLSVCLSVNFFSVKDFSATTWVRILKFGTKLDSDELYCVTKEQPHIAYQSLYLFIFFLSNGNFCHRYLSSYWSQCFQILCTSSGWQSVLCKWKLSEVYRGYIVFAFSVIMLVCLSVCLSVNFFSSKISQQLLGLGFCNLVQSLIVMSCIV